MVSAIGRRARPRSVQGHLETFGRGSQIVRYLGRSRSSRVKSGHRLLAGRRGAEWPSRCTQEAFSESANTQGMFGAAVAEGNGAGARGGSGGLPGVPFAATDSRQRKAARIAIGAQVWFAGYCAVWIAALRSWAV
jgi:hypothetical protein